MMLRSTVLAGLLALNLIPTAAVADPHGRGKATSGVRSGAPAKKDVPKFTVAQFKANVGADSQKVLEKLRTTGIKVIEVNLFGDDGSNAVTALLKVVSDLRGGNLSGITLRLKKQNELVIRIGKVRAPQSAATPATSSSEQRAAESEEEDDE